MQNESIVPSFQSAFHALSFYNQKSPVRQKNINLFEADFRSSERPDEFSFECPARRWAIVAFALGRALRIQSERNRKLFIRCFCGLDSEQMLHPSEAASLAGITTRRAYQILNEIMRDFERNLKIRGLISEETPDSKPRNSTAEK